MRNPKEGALPHWRRKPSGPQVIIVRGDKARSFTVRPWMTATFLGASLLFLGAYITGTGYLFVRDGVVANALVNQATLRQGYEDRIAGLRSEIDRLASHNLMNQQALEEQIGALLTRQSELSERQQMLTGLDMAATHAEVDLLPAAIPPAPVPRPAPADRAQMAVPAGVKDALPAAAIVGPDMPLPDVPAEAATGPVTPAKAAQTIGAVERALDAMENDIAATLGTATDTISDRTERIASVLMSLGISDAPGIESAQGGPYEPLGYAGVDDPGFLSTIALASDEIERLTLLRAAAEKLPLVRPMPDVEISSGFGRRLDPFVRRPSLHTGIDFRATYGAAVRPTAPGTVVAAGYNGGYGNMVDVDHGDGVVTRYGHLSRIEVKVGDAVSPSKVIGRVGSTGRSTGPHLHYELRVNDEAIDPMRFIRAGVQLRDLL